MKHDICHSFIYETLCIFVLENNEIVNTKTKIMKTTTLRATIEQYKDRFEEPFNAIEEGGNFNGKIYTKRIGNGAKYDLGVYVSGKYYALGRVYKEYVDEVKEAFYLLLAEGFVTEEEVVGEEKNVETTTDNEPLFIVKTTSGKTGEVYAHPDADNYIGSGTKQELTIKIDGKVGYVDQLGGMHLLTGSKSKKSYITLGGLAIKSLFNLDLREAKLEIVSFGDGSKIPTLGTSVQINRLLSTYGTKLTKEIVIREMQPKKETKVPTVGKNAKWVNGMWVYPSGNYGEDVLSGYYEE